MRILIGILLAVLLIVVLFTVVFPWFDRQFVTDPVLGWKSAGMPTAVPGVKGLFAA